MGIKIKEYRPYQNDCILKYKNYKDTSGRIIAPTASGKTYLQARILSLRLDGCSVHLVVAPRIALLNQHIKEYRYSIPEKKYISYAFHSGSYEVDYNQVQWSERSGTKPEQVQEEIVRARRLGMDLVIFSTYASFGKLSSVFFKTAIFDESQYCIAEDVFENLKNIDSDQYLYFTATEKHTISGNGRGLNNKDVFGGIIYKILPQILIDEGWILAPRLHIMKADKTTEGSTLIDEVSSLAEGQIQQTLGMPFRKILFACKGTSCIKKIIKKIKVLKKRHPNYRVFTIMSNGEFGAMIDGVKVSREKFFAELDKDEDSFVFHYDIISEGIDVSGFTGVCILRYLDKTKLLQTIGRAQRVWDGDKGKDIDKRIKKHAVVSVARINGNAESEDYVRNIVIQMRLGGYDVTKELIDCTDDPGFGIGEDFAIDPLTQLNRRGETSDVLEHIFHDIEKDEEMYTIRYLTPVELIAALI